MKIKANYSEDKEAAKTLEIYGRGGVNLNIKHSCNSSAIFTLNQQEFSNCISRFLIILPNLPYFPYTATHQ